MNHKKTNGLSQVIDVPRGNCWQFCMPHFQSTGRKSTSTYENWLSCRQLLVRSVYLMDINITNRIKICSPQNEYIGLHFILARFSKRNPLELLLAGLKTLCLYQSNVIMRGGLKKFVTYRY